MSSSITDWIVLGDRIAVKRDPPPPQSFRGIFLPSPRPDADGEGFKTTTGVVYAKGKGHYADALNVGDRVRLNPVGRGHDVKIGSEWFLFVLGEHLLGKLEE